MKKKLNVLLIGDPMIDVYHYGKATRISPEAPLIVFKKDHTVHRLGGALNLGANLMAFCNVDFYCARYMGELYEEQIDVNDPLFIRKTRFIDTDYNIPTGLRFDEDLQYNEFTNFDTIFTKIKNNIEDDKYDFIVLSDYDKGTIGEKCLNQLSKVLNMKTLHQGKIPLVFLDTKTSDFNKFIRAGHLVIDYFKPNEIEFRKYEKYHNENFVKYTRGFFDNIFVTKSKLGISYYDGRDFEDEFFNIPSFCNKLVDVTGAGDSAMAGLIYGYNTIIDTNESIEEKHECMAVYANAFAKLACENKGTFVITLQHFPEIEKIVKEYYRVKKKT